MKKIFLLIVIGALAGAGAASLIDQKGDYRLAKVEQYSSLYIFHESMPVDDYEVLFKYRIVGAGITSYRSLKKQHVRNCLKRTPAANGIIIKGHGQEALFIKLRDPLKPAE